MQWTLVTTISLIRYKNLGYDLLFGFPLTKISQVTSEMCEWKPNKFAKFEPHSCYLLWVKRLKVWNSKSSFSRYEIGLYVISCSTLVHLRKVPIYHWVKIGAYMWRKAKKAIFAVKIHRFLMKTWIRQFLTRFSTSDWFLAGHAQNQYWARQWKASGKLFRKQKTTLNNIKQHQGKVVLVIHRN